MAHTTNRPQASRLKLRPGFVRGVLGAVAILALALSFLTLPSLPHEPDLDFSLGMGLDFARAHGLQFGTNFVSTYGPLGFLVFFNFSPTAAFAQMAADAVLCLTVAASLWVLGSRLRVPERVLLLVLFLWGATNIFPRIDLVLNAGLLCWTLICLTSPEGPRLRISLVILLLLAAFAGLAKSYFIFAGPLFLGLVMLDLAARKQNRLAVSVGTGYLAAVGFGWVCSGQELSNFLPWLENSARVLSGYTQGMGWQGTPQISRIGFLMLSAIGLLLCLRTVCVWRARGENGLFRPALGLAASGFMVATSWRHGFLRADVGHAWLFLAFVPVLVFGLEALPRGTGQKGLAVRVAAMACSLLGVWMLQTAFLPPGWRSVTQPLRALAYHLKSLVAPAEYHERLSTQLDEIRQRAQLPKVRRLVGGASVDVFGNDQAYALLNELAYKPRPVFQSHVACSPPLMRMNERFYAAEAPPEYVLLRLAPLDRRFPPLEDALVLRHLLTDYAFVIQEGPFVLLRRRSLAENLRALLREGRVQAGRPIDLSPYGSKDLWLEIELQPSWLGRFRQLLFQPPIVRLAAWQKARAALLHRQQAPASMMRAGFVASPLLVRNEDWLAQMTNSPAGRPGAYTVELQPGSEKWWKAEIHYRLYEIEQASPEALPAGTTAPFHVFRQLRWRPDRAPSGSASEQLALLLMVLLPAALAGMGGWLARRFKSGAIKPGWPVLVAGNCLVFLFFLSLALLGGELWFRLGYDTTDSLAYTKVCERWVERHWKVNNLGCRDDVNYSPTRVPGRRRITFVGDSFTAGHGIKNVEDRFPNRLRGIHPEWDVQVLANVGLDTGAEATLLDRVTAQGYGLEDVVLVYCLNDIGDLLPAEGLAFERVLAELDHGHWLLRNSYCLNFLAYRLKAAEMPELRDYFGYVREAYAGPPWEQQKARLTALRDLVRARGGRLWVVTFPFLQQLGPAYPYRAVHEQIDQFWRDLGVPHLDLLPLFEGIPANKLVVNRFDAHPNEYANAIAAKAIDGFLQQRSAPP